jgi:signal peptidase II
MTKKTKQAKPQRTSMKGSHLWGLMIFTLLILIDQLTKAFADAYFLADGAPSRIDLIPGWLGICMTYNQGISYGLGADAPEWAKILVVAMTGVLMLVFSIIYFRLDKRRRFMKIAIIFIVAGGVGNLIDRVYYRVWEAEALFGVRDMVDLSRFGFAVCNFADFFISGGAVAFLLSFLFFDKDALFPVGKYRRMAKEENVATDTEIKPADTCKESENG